MTPEQMQRIRKQITDAERLLKIMREDIQKASKGGIDVKEQERSFAELSKRVIQLKAAFL